MAYAPWKLMRVISGHHGWVRYITVDPGNQFFVTSSSDRTIKYLDLATGNLKLTFTGHISTIRSVIVSARYPFLFSCAKDKKVKCQQVAEEILYIEYGTSEPDNKFMFWKDTQILLIQLFCLEFEPQVVSGPQDSMIKLLDMTSGKCISNLTNHINQQELWLFIHQNIHFVQQLLIISKF